MSHRTMSIAIVAVLLGCSFGAGYVLGRGDRTTVPDLFGLDRGSSEATQSYVTLKKSELRLGRERYHLCGDNRTSGMVVRQFPASGESVPVGSAVDVWRATADTFFENLNKPCQHPLAS